MSNNIYSFPYAKHDGGYIKTEVTYDKSCVAVMDAIYEMELQMMQAGFTPAYVVVGKYEYKKILAFYSNRFEKPSVGETVDDYRIVVLDQEHYLDLVPKPQEMLMKIVKEENGLYDTTTDDAL